MNLFFAVTLNLINSWLKNKTVTTNYDKTKNKIDKIKSEGNFHLDNLPYIFSLY